MFTRRFIAAGVLALLAAGSLAAKPETADQVPATPDTIARAAEDRSRTTKILEVLDRPLRIEFVEGPLSDVLNYIKQTAKLPLHVDRASLEEAGIALDTPLSFSESELPLRSSLALLLEPIGLDWVIHHNALLITTSDAVEHRYLSTKAYDVSALIEPSDDADVQTAALEALVDTIETTIAPRTWDIEEEGPGTIAGFEMGEVKTLVVHQSRVVHDQIEMLLDELTRKRARPADAD
jgi:hypothetical protein